MLPRHRILLVDDYPDAAEIACVLLSIEGHECRSATSGYGGLEEARRFHPDIAILDIGLPDLSGYELARALRKLEHGRAMYLAAITGWGEPQDRTRAFEAGFDCHILKPADQTKLHDILMRADARAATAGARGRS